MPRKESPKTTKEKESLWDEIEALNKERQEKLIADSGVLDYLDPTKEEDVRIAAHLLNITEEEARDRFYLSPERRAELSESLKNLSEEELSEGLKKLREENERKRKIEETIREIREKGTSLRDMGLGITTTKELLKAVRKYHSIEEALVTFRQEVADNGYYGIECEMIPVIRVYGTARDKALLVAMGYYDAKRSDKERLTEKEVKSIRESIYRSSEEEINTYRDCFILYETIEAGFWMYRYLETKTDLSTERAATEITKYEDMKRTQEILNKVGSLIPSDRQQELSSMLPDSIPSDEDIQQQWEEVKKAIKTANSDKAYFVGGLNGLRDWMTEHNATDLMRMRFKDIIEVQLDFGDIVKNIPEQYYRRSNPDTSVEEADEKALLLTFDEVNPKDVTYRGFRKYLDDEYDRRN